MCVYIFIKENAKVNNKALEERRKKQKKKGGDFAWQGHDTYVVEAKTLCVDVTLFYLLFLPREVTLISVLQIFFFPFLFLCRNG